RDGSLKVTDFGIARMSESQQETMTGDALGSVHYVSPEQARGSKIDARSDIYSLGVVMYEMLTGRLPFEGDTPVAVVLQHINSIPLLPSEINPTIPAGLEEVTMKAMSPAPENRYASAQDMVIDLDLLKNDPGAVFNYGVVPHVSRAVAAEPQPEPQIYEPEPEIVDPEPYYEPEEEYLPAQRQRAAVSHRAESRRAERRDDRRRAYRDYSDFDDDYDDFRPRARTPVFVFLITGILTAAIFFGGAAFIISTIFGAENAIGTDDISAPNLVGKNFSEVLSSIQYSEYNIVEDESVYSDSIPEGVIISQEPPAGRTIKATTEIYVTISLGPKKISLVDLIGVESRAAKLKLESLGLLVSMEYEISDTVAEGYVISMDPAPYTELVEDDIVKLVVSLGPEERYATVPELTGMTEEEAERALELQNLVLGNVIPKETENEEDHGKIYDQSVRPNAEVIEKTAIDIYVYEYVEPDVPDIPDFPDFPDGETAGTAVLWVKLDETAEFSEVVILSMGEVLYEQTYLSEYGTVPVTLEGTGSSLVSIYVNGILVDEKIAVYE
ncbi:MAG: PASTA domain-containing protein, partial [Ruminococcaceae bacterium]|nr:PASTA domain-containing protein [Oscillospiraceae bacterium]